MPKKTNDYTRKAAAICSDVDPQIRKQAITLAKAVLTLEAKINEQLPIYHGQPLAQEVKKGDGNIILRENPAVKEFRATVRDYSAALKELKSIIEKNPALNINPEKTTLEAILDKHNKSPEIR